MSDHYFSSRPSSKNAEYQIETELLGNHLVFHTDNGVFSKKGIDFGSRLLIESVEINEGDSILDLGCAYGVVGIALAKACPNSKVTMVEINERACELARENSARNSVDEQIEVYHGDGFTPISGKKFDHILLNPPIRAGKQVIYSLFTDATRYLNLDGCLWIVIRKQQGAESAIQKLKEDYSTVEVVFKKKGYWIVRAKR
jgi:16S rRNA (guanine1207-N2)-methyltransferase